jgi:hypothetical protein
MPHVLMKRAWVLRKVLARLSQYFLAYSYRYFTPFCAVMITCVWYFLTLTALCSAGRKMYAICPGDIGIECNWQWGNATVVATITCSGRYPDTRRM